MEQKQMKKEKRKYIKSKPQTEKQLANLRPRQSSIRTAEEFEQKIENYFKKIERKKQTPSVAELAYELGFSSRQTLLNYGNEEKHKDMEREEKISIIDAIKKAKLRIEIFLEKNLIEGKQVAGTIFNLKNNYGYSDKTELEHKGKLQITIEGIEKF